MDEPRGEGSEYCGDRKVCRRRYYESHREIIMQKKRERYTTERRRQEYLRHQEAETRAPLGDEPA